ARWSDASLARGLHRDQTDEYARRPADALQRGEGKTTESATLASQGDQDPGFGLFGQQTGLEMPRSLRTDIGHLGQFCIAERRAVLGRYFDGHELRRPLIGGP